MPCTRTSHFRDNAEIKRDVMLAASHKSACFPLIRLSTLLSVIIAYGFSVSTRHLCSVNRLLSTRGDTVFSLVSRTISELDPVLDNQLIVSMDLYVTADSVF